MLSTSLTSLWSSWWSPAFGPSSRDEGIVAEICRTRILLRAAEDQELATAIAGLKGRAGQTIARSAPPELIHCFALMSESVRRTLGLEYYREQLLAGLALTRRSIAEMATGEGKTIVAGLAAAWFALRGEGVHVMTVNAYLAERDFGLLAPAFERLGLQVGLLSAQLPPTKRREIYDCDIVYGAGCEFGFDYLRDQLRLKQQGRRLGDAVRRSANESEGRATMQRGRIVAIVDEADSVLLDEATTPLILAVPSEHAVGQAAVYHAASDCAARMVVDRDFVVVPESASVRLTDAGLQRLAADQQPAPATTQRLARPWATYIEQALTARHVLLRDVNYVVADQKVTIVDPFTGRLFSERSWQAGLHQAVEVKEGVPVTAENHAAARISRQRYFGLYEHVSGMTGTGLDAAAELRAAYRLTVAVIPLHRPSKRQTLPDRFFATEDQKWSAIAHAVRQVRAGGRAVLVGTRTIAQSEALAQRFKSGGIPFRLLNGKQDEAEARIIALAGEPGAVTIATNMAGRGTDIRLSAEVEDRGGLHVIGAERHASRRVDRQLIGRCARQGDPGSCQFFLSADDELLRRHAPQLVARLRERADAAGEVRGDFSRTIATAQRQAEQQASEERQKLLTYDTWLNDLVARLG